MKKLLLSLALILLTITFSNAQTTATDFTAVDCNNVSHNCFSVLSTGKVIVLNWVMPCSTCIPASVSAYNIVQGFAVSNPGQVVHYLVDDNGGTTCATLTSWANTNGISPNTTIFRNFGNVINEANYGGTGMPHVVVIGPDQLIYFNGRNAAANNPTAVTNAINQALLATGIQQPVNSVFNLSVATSLKSVTVNYTLSENANVTLSMLNEIGQSVSKQELGKQPAGKHNADFDLNGIAEGIYFIRLSTENNSQTIKFSVTK
ncbi:MAG TPA: T9SS type A sorting domain-containing protein [Bacteroidia bacterium]|nr:T9SS type A sorting domain-containing protein [Bacteroidia bacterium]